MLLFFFKQKTAYEMRISDWSSDVCSSDLRIPGDAAVNAARLGTAAERRNIGARPDRGVDAGAVLGDGIAGDGDGRAGRSEEHTSELQSLMRISYAVFCLKKKNKKYGRTTEMKN